MLATEHTPCTKLLQRRTQQKYNGPVIYTLIFIHLNISKQHYIVRELKLILGRRKQGTEGWRRDGEVMKKG